MVYEFLLQIVGNYEDLIVNDNLLSRFESFVFQPPMEKMIPSDGGSRTGYLRIGNSKKRINTAEN